MVTSRIEAATEASEVEVSEVIEADSEEIVAEDSEAIVELDSEAVHSEAIEAEGIFNVQDSTMMTSTYHQTTPDTLTAGLATLKTEIQLTGMDL